MKKLTTLMKSLAKDESGQGGTEYVLLLVVVVALVMMFKEQIRGAMSEKLAQLSDSIKGFTGD